MSLYNQTWEIGDCHEPINPLVIIGVDSEIDWKICGDALAHLLYTRISDGLVSIWDMPASVKPEYAESCEILKKVAEKKKFDFTDSLPGTGAGAVFYGGYARSEFG